MSGTLFGTDSDANISPCGQYRYSLTREWDENLPCVCFVMLNPSTADAAQDDPTLRRCKAFARAWGFGSLQVVNLFGLRATDPGKLRLHPDPIGPENDAYLDGAISRAGRVVVAWGRDGDYRGRGPEVARRIREPWCLKLTKEGHPWHPLYVPAAAQLIRFSANGGL